MNLIGNSAAESCSEATGFFKNVQCLYNFFSASTYRWSILQKCLEMKTHKPPMVKKICNTRWSARADAIKSIALGFNEIQIALRGYMKTPIKNNQREQKLEIYLGKQKHSNVF